MLSLIDVIGSAAACLTTVSFVPQVMKVWRTRSGADISTLMYAVFISGMALWFVYGILMHAWPIILSNGVTILLAGAVLALKHYFARRNIGKHSLR